MENILKIGKILSIFAVIISIAWYLTNPAFEPGLAVVTSLSALITTMLVKPNKDKTTQKQTISKSSIGIQAGGDVFVGRGKNGE